MKPLREEFKSDDPNQAAGAALLASVRPLEPSAARQQRIRFTLHGWGAKRVALRLSPAFAAAMLILGATGASAMVARFIVHAQLFAHEPKDSAAPSGEAANRARAPRGGSTPEPAPAVGAPTILDSPGPAPVVAPPTEAVHKLDPAQAVPRQQPSKAHVTPPPATAAGTSSPGAALMIEAMQARRSGDMARARSRLAEYRTKYPDGALQEEALALSVEAAAALGDENASRFAAQYLQRYPNGRFREQAERALKSSAH